MQFLTALLILITGVFPAHRSPEPPPQNVLTIEVYTHHTKIIDNGELITILDDSCRDKRIWNTNAHTCNGDIDTLVSIIDGYLPLPYDYAATIVRFQS